MDKTEWEQLNENQVCVKVDTSSCGFTGNPVYFPSVLGAEKHDFSMGAAVVVDATKSSFKVCAGYEKITTANAKKWKWHINWIGMGKSSKPRPAGSFTCYGRSMQRGDLEYGHDKQNKLFRQEREIWKKHIKVGKWQQVNEDTIKMDVSTAYCGFTETPIYVIRLAGLPEAQQTTGSEAVIKPHASGFTVLMHGIKKHEWYKGNMSAWEAREGPGNSWVYFAAIGKVAHSKKSPYPWTMWYLPRGIEYKASWTTHKMSLWMKKLEKCHATQTMVGKKDARFDPWVDHVHLLSLTCEEEPLPWNIKESGYLANPKCNLNEIIWKDPKLVPDFPKDDFRRKMKYEEAMAIMNPLKDRILKKCKVALMHQVMEPGSGLPTPPPTPPTPQPTTSAPTPMPTAAPTPEKPKGACCCDRN